jgi:hypothetical protein
MLKTFQSLQQWVLVLKLIQKALTNNNWYDIIISVRINRYRRQ